MARFLVAWLIDQMVVFDLLTFIFSFIGFVKRVNLYRTDQPVVIVEEDGVKRFSTGELVKDTDAGYFSADQILQILRPYAKQASLTGESITVTLEGRAFFETAETVSLCVCVCACVYDTETGGLTWPFVAPPQ